MTSRMKMAIRTVSFVSVLLSRARETATRVEQRVFSELCKLSDNSSVLQQMVRDERRTFSKAKRFSGQKSLPQPQHTL